MEWGYEKYVECHYPHEICKWCIFYVDMLEWKYNMVFMNFNIKAETAA